MGLTTGREERERGVGYVHFKQSDKISNQRHATSSQAVLILLQMVSERWGRSQQIEATAKGKVEDSYLAEAQTLRRCIPKLLIGKYPLAS